MDESKIALRMDDVGASSKRYEVYSKLRWHFRSQVIFSGDWLFLKYLPGIKAWGPYNELSGRDWHEILDFIKSKNWKMTVGITAAWADSENDLIPFPKKFPDAAKAIKEGVNAGLIEVANHGLSHSVLQNNAFRPKLFEGNRLFHREFHSWLGPSVHEKHIMRSQEILQDFFEQPVVTFVPPGNVFAEYTAEIAARYGLKFVSCQTEPRLNAIPQILGNLGTLTFHDRDLVINGIAYFDHLAEKIGEKSVVFVKELVSTMRL